jgi:chaperonin GroEL
VNSYRKAKSVAKDILVSSDKLDSKVLFTMKTISDIVGSTLGPGGRPILIERQEYGLPHMFTKDGVTVFRNLGFEDPTCHAIMEAARDAATRTVAEAGDGTTTATVLAEAIVRNTNKFCKAHPKVSPQKVVRRLEQIFKEVIAPTIKSLSLTADETMLHSVAKLSANGDKDLADAVMKCFNIVGDDGNISIIEQSGPSRYEVEALKGFPISIGYEDSCAKFGQLFLNDKINGRCFLEKPVFVLYYGSITEIQTIYDLMLKVADAWAHPENHNLDRPFNHNVVIVATGYSESVLAHLASNFGRPETINVFPLVTPKGPIQNGEMYFLYDLAAVTGANVFDPISNPIDSATLKDLGYGIKSFEANRYRSTILGLCDEALVEARAEEVKRGLASAVSKLDINIMNERIAKLVGGIAKLKVIGASNGELREKRDRAEDAVCAVRGAIKSGCLPGGGYMLKMLMPYIKKPGETDMVVNEVLEPSFKETVLRIFKNCGMNDVEIMSAWDSIGNEVIKVKEPLDENGEGASFVEYKQVPFVYDAWEGKRVNAVENGILDSTPAVLEAIRNSLSIASLLGTMGGTVVFKRDDTLERQEAIDSSNFMKTFDGE